MDVFSKFSSGLIAEADWGTISDILNTGTSHSDWPETYTDKNKLLVDLMQVALQAGYIRNANRIVQTFKEGLVFTVDDLHLSNDCRADQIKKILSSYDIGDLHLSDCSITNDDFDQILLYLKIGKPIISGSLILGGNVITAIKPGAFAGLKITRFLSLGSLEKVLSGAFQGLTVCNFVLSVLTKIEPGAFDDLTIEYGLYLHELVEVETGVFENQKITFLYLPEAEKIKPGALNKLIVEDIVLGEIKEVTSDILQGLVADRFQLPGVKIIRRGAFNVLAIKEIVLREVEKLEKGAFQVKVEALENQRLVITGLKLLTAEVELGALDGLTINDLSMEEFNTLPAGVFDNVIITSKPCVVLEYKQAYKESDFLRLFTIRGALGCPASFEYPLTMPDIMDRLIKINSFLIFIYACHGQEAVNVNRHIPDAGEEKAELIILPLEIWQLIFAHVVFDSYASIVGDFSKSGVDKFFSRPLNGDSPGKHFGVQSRAVATIFLHKVIDKIMTAIDFDQTPSKLM